MLVTYSYKLVNLYVPGQESGMILASTTEAARYFLPRQYMLIQLSLKIYLLIA